MGHQHTWAKVKLKEGEQMVKTNALHRKPDGGFFTLEHKVIDAISIGGEFAAHPLPLEYKGKKDSNMWGVTHINSGFSITDGTIFNLSDCRVLLRLLKKHKISLRLQAKNSHKIVIKIHTLVKKVIVRKGKTLQARRPSWKTNT